MNDKRQWYGVVLGGAGGLLLGAFLVHLWTTGHPEATLLLVQTIVLVATAIILAFTLVSVKHYAHEAWRTAEAAHQQVEVTQEQVEATLTGKTAIFLEPPIKTVEEYRRDGYDMGNLPPKWLILKVTNEGQMKAINVEACASWTCPRGHESAPDYGAMKKEGELHKFDQKEYGTWWAWRLRPGELRCFYLKPPERGHPNDPREGRCLGLIWWGPGYTKWTNWILLQEEDGGKWSMNWLLGKPRRGAYDCWPQTEGGDLPELPPKESSQPCPKYP